MKYFFGLLVTLLTIIGGTPLYARLQGQARIDSLLKELPRQIEDTNKASLLHMLSGAYGNISSDEGIKYELLSLDLCTKLLWKIGIAKANGSLGLHYSHKGDFAKSMEHYERALQMFQELGDKKGIGTAYNNIGLLYDNQRNYYKFLEYSLKALKIFEEIGEKRSIATTSTTIGGIYSNAKNFTEAFAYTERSLKTWEELHDEHGIAKTLGSIGNIYVQQGKYPEAMEYYQRSARIFEEIGDKRLMVTGLTNMGDLYAKTKNYTMAYDNYRLALKIAKEMNERPGEANQLSHLGALFIHIINDTSQKLMQVMPGMEPALVKYLPAGALPVNKAALLRDALSYLHQALALSEEKGEPHVLRVIYENLALAYELSGNYKKALDASNKWHLVKDSIFLNEKDEKLVQLRLSDQFERRKMADSLKVAEKERIAAITLQRQKSYTYMGIAGIVLLCCVSFFVLRERGKSEKQRKIAENERKKSDGLLLNILPTEIAEELKKNGATTARHYDNVTVLFTDFVNFTQAGEQMSPQALIDELHACFKAFDEITTKYNIEKIKTIGDAYLAVAGLPTADPKHADNIVHAAVEINTFMADRLSKMGSERTFAVRIGIHSGSVVAGIVGVKKFAYDIWGDTVNTAARMEQNSEAGKINISQSTYELVKDKFACEYRGEVEAKGKGVMKMYFVS